MNEVEYLREENERLRSVNEKMRCCENCKNFAPVNTVYYMRPFGCKLYASEINNCLGENKKDWVLKND